MTKLSKQIKMLGNLVTPSRLSEISMKSWRARVKTFLVTPFMIKSRAEEKPGSPLESKDLFETKRTVFISIF